MGGDFQLYIVNIDGSGLRRVTTEGSFNSFPMFSFDGKRIAWCSDRGAHCHATLCARCAFAEQREGARRRGAV